MIRLRFVEGGGWDSHVIRWDTRCTWSHVEYMLDNYHTCGAQLKGGVAVRKITDPIYKHAVRYAIVAIPCTPEQDELYKQSQLAKVGCPYDWRAIVSFGLGERDWREPGDWFCSEDQMIDLENVLSIHLPMDQPVWRITPRDVWMLGAGIGTVERIYPA